MGHLNPRRMPLISWIILPAIVAWIAINYLIGVANRPIWESNPVAQAQTQSPATPLPVIREIPKLKWNGGGLVTFWFDDAFASQFEAAYPILEEHGFAAALSVPTHAINQTSYMNWSEVKNLSLRGWEITSHSRSHNCDAKQNSDPNYLKSEVVGSKQDLEARGLMADQYVTPCGVSNTAMASLIRQNYNSLRTSGDGFNPIPVTDPYNLLVEEVRIDTTTDQVQTWVDQARENRKWLILLIHRVENSEQKFSTTPKEFGQIVQIIDGSHLQVVVPTQVLNLSKL